MTSSARALIYSQFHPTEIPRIAETGAIIGHAEASYRACPIKSLLTSPLLQKNATSQISTTLAANLTSYVLRRDMVTVRKFVTMLGANSRVLLKVAGKVREL